MNVKSIVGSGLLMLSIIVIMVFLLRKHEPFFNLRDILKKHLGLFSNATEYYVVFYFIPVLFAVGLTLLYEAGVSFYSELSIVLGIVLSILLAILAIIGVFDFSKVIDNEQKKKSCTVLSETLNAIVFTSVLCLFLLLYGLSIIVVSGASLPWLPINRSILKGIASGIAYYLFLVILLNLLLIIKQMCKLIEFNQIAKKE